MSTKIVKMSIYDFQSDDRNGSVQDIDFLVLFCFVLRAIQRKVCSLLQMRYMYSLKTLKMVPNFYQIAETQWSINDIALYLFSVKVARVRILLLAKSKCNIQVVHSSSWNKVVRKWIQAQ